MSRERCQQCAKRVERELKEMPTHAKVFWCLSSLVPSGRPTRLAEDEAVAVSTCWISSQRLADFFLFFTMRPSVGPRCIVVRGGRSLRESGSKNKNGAHRVEHQHSHLPLLLIRTERAEAIEKVGLVSTVWKAEVLAQLSKGNFLLTLPERRRTLSLGITRS